MYTSLSNRKLHTRLIHNITLTYRHDGENMLEEELLKAGYDFIGDGEGTFLVHYNKSTDFSPIGGKDNCVMREDDDNYYIDAKYVEGEAIYPKQDWSLEEALEICFKDEEL